MATKKQLNFDVDPAKTDDVRDFTRSFFEHCRDAQSYQMDKYQRVYKIYRMQRDMVGRDPNRSNLALPKLYAMVETIMPIYIDALIGVRPYIPLELPGKEASETASAMTDLLDAFLAEGEFHQTCMNFAKYAVLYGNGYLESFPMYETRNIKIMEPQTGVDGEGRPVVLGYKPTVVPKTFFRLGTRAYAPFQIFKDPSARSLANDDCRGIIKYRANVSKRQIMKMAERNFFPNFDPEKLEAGFQSTQQDDWCRKLAQSIGVPVPKTDDDMGVWLSFESGDRYIDVWNFTHVLRDVPNPYDHKQINLTKITNTTDPNPETEWWGIGEGEPVEGLCYALEENWNQTFDNHNLLNQGVLFYDEDALSVDQLAYIPGNRIPVTPSPGMRIQDAVYERPTPGLSPDHYRIPNQLELMIDSGSGISDIVRGDQTGDSQTAREAILRRQAGDSRMKLKVKMGEWGLADFGMKALATVDQFCPPEDMASKIGPQRAMMLSTVNPMNMAQKPSFAFKGSDRLAEQQIKRQDAKDIYQLMAGQRALRQDWLADWTLQKFDVPEEQRRRAIISDAVIALAQMIMMQKQQQAEMDMQAQKDEAKQKSKAESSRQVSNGKQVGAQKGNARSGRDKNEKLGMRL